MCLWVGLCVSDIPIDNYVHGNSFQHYSLLPNTIQSERSNATILWFVWITICYGQNWIHLEIGLVVYLLKHKVWTVTRNR